MFTENEVASLIADEKIHQLILDLRKEFVKEEAHYLEIDEHDFLSLVLVAPSVGIAMANGSVSLFEEMALNKKARKLSKGGYILKKDPVVVAMGFLIKHFDKWEDRFYETIGGVISKLFDKEQMIRDHAKDAELSDEEFCLVALKAPFGFIRAITSFFMDDEDEDIIKHRKINKVEFDRVVEIGNKIGFSEIPFFKKFLTTFDVK